MIYQAILEQGVAKKIKPKLADLGSRLLKNTVMNLPDFLRDDQWVSEAVSWLGKLDATRADPLLNTILKEKKYFFWPVWPTECRRVARDVLDAQPDVLDVQSENDEIDVIDERETSVDEIQ